MVDSSQNTPSLSAPSAIRRWRFGQLPDAELLLRLQQHLLISDQQSNWQLTWLNNDGYSVIGLLPKVSWTVYPSTTDSTANPVYQVIKTCRDTQSSSSRNMTYTDWQAELIAYSEQNYATDKYDITQSQYDKPKYQNGFIGFIGYDIASQALSPNANINCSDQPAAVLGHYDIYLTPEFSENNQIATWSLHTHAYTPNSDNNSKVLSLILNKLLSYLDEIDNELSITHLIKNTSPVAPLILTPKWQKSNYQHAFAKTQHYLVQGDCYQINLTQPWQGYLGTKDKNTGVTFSLINYLPALHRNTQAPFAGYLGLTKTKNAYLNAHSNVMSFELLSCSPELFFTFINEEQTGSRYIRTKPIKGTRPRGINTEQDLLLKQQLIDSAKDQAENVMIVDLLRNDLGKYAKVGSVKVPKLFTIESFSNVHHMVSTITAELKPNTHPLAVLFGSLPAGSITGTPKKRAVEIIAELEEAPRGAYCGTMGYMNFDGSGQWNVLIRTLQAQQLASGASQVSLWAGGGITVASECNEEYQECLDKVGNLLKVLARSDR